MAGLTISALAVWSCIEFDGKRQHSGAGYAMLFNTGGQASKATPLGAVTKFGGTANVKRVKILASV